MRHIVIRDGTMNVAPGTLAGAAVKSGVFHTILAVGNLLMIIVYISLYK